ncbi:MAG: phosphoribosylformylglycinamidine cyclo-ligase [Bacillota bacterium]
MAISYKDAGVDVHEGYRAVDLMKKHVKSTFDSNVLGDIGSFGGFYSIEGFNYKKPVLVAGTDGVGTKLKYSFTMEKYDTVGIDCVAMCANDIVCQGAKPLLFLDYIATGKLIPEVVAEIVGGIANGCRQTGSALIGGETAEMPNFYPAGEFDLAGFSVGIVDRDSIISGKDITSGDVLVGLTSSGIHSNGYSLVRKLFDPDDKAMLKTYSDELGMTYGEALLTPTKLYVKPALEIIKGAKVKGIAHVTGGGFVENIPRFLPSKELGIEIDVNAYKMPPLFEMLVKKAGISNQQAYNTFNMGIGMVMCVAETEVDALQRAASAVGETTYVIGRVNNKGGVSL